ncbi:MAG TPA: hypothetical protein VNK52_11025 [Hyphomicrobiaceae bacterium]|nr:hypothetical protein [Hyphomicrobiaceae bacterium]
MFGLRRSDPATIHIIADHLDAVLAAGEDLLGLRLDLAECARSDRSGIPGERLRTFVEDVRTLEALLVGHTLQARRRARELVAAEAPVKQLLGLFAGGMAVLEDAVAELGDTSATDFETGDDPLAYLRSRGLLAADAGSLLGLERIVVGEQFLIVRRIALGMLMDLAAASLHALEDCYDLADSEEADNDEASVEETLRQLAAARAATESWPAGP